MFNAENGFMWQVLHAHQWYFMHIICMKQIIPENVNTNIRKTLVITTKE